MKSSPLIATVVLCLCLAPALAWSQQAGQIVFSKSRIDPASPSNLTTEFQSGDPIYAVAFFDKPVSAMSRSGAAKSVTAEIFLYELKPPLYDYQEPSEAQLDFGSLTISGGAVQKTHLPVDIVPLPSANTAYSSPDLVYKKFGPRFDGPVKFAEALAKLPAGDHNLIVKVNCNYEFVAEGRIQIRGSDYTAYGKMATDLNEAAVNRETASASMPKPARNDPSLEADMTRALKASQTYRDRIKGEVLKVVIIDPDWMIRRHAVTGIILHRYIRATIAVKNVDGSCTGWQLVTFQQDYVGNQFQATRFDGVGDPFPIPCENVGAKASVRGGAAVGG